MKALYTLLALILFAFSAQAQDVTLYEQKFNRTAPNDVPANLSTSNWIVDNEEPISGDYFRTSISGSAVKQFTMQQPISTMDLVFSGITWKEFRTQHWRHNGSDKRILRKKQNKNSTKIDNNSPVVLEYSIDGVNFSSKGIEFSQNTSRFYTWAPVNNGGTVYLPSEVLAQSMVYLRWTIRVNASNDDYYAIDDIRIFGESDQAAMTLPVELISFNGVSQNNDAKLTWATAQEKNSDRFLIERSQDGVNFTQVGEVAGNGNSSTRIDYSFTDPQPMAGTVYYRLRQIDVDGTQEISKIVAVTVPAKGLQLSKANIVQVYPTVASAEVTIKLVSDNAQVAVLDANGKSVAEYSNASGEVVVPVAHLKQGIYFVAVTDGTQRQTRRFVKQ